MARICSYFTHLRIFLPLVLLLLLSFAVPTALAQQVHTSTQDSTGSLLNQQNQALIQKILDDARETRTLIDAILPHGKGTPPLCNANDILHWNTSTKAWQCREETDPKAKTFAKANLPVCGTNAFLYPSSSTAFACRTLNTKGAMGPAPTWQWSGDGSSLNVMKADGSYSGWVYLRGDPGSYYRWYTGAWSGCSNGCGNGTQTRAVQCRRNNVDIVADSFCAGSRPTDTQACTNHAGCSYSWQTGGWSGCSTSCGDGVQTRTIWCQRQDGAHVDYGYCGGGQPATQQGCHAGYTYSHGGWGSYGACSTTCGGGTQTRSRACIRCDGVGVDCSFCGGNCSESTSCNTHSCGGSSGGWGGCDSPCGECQFSPCCGTCCGSCMNPGQTCNCL